MTLALSACSTARSRPQIDQPSPSGGVTVRGRTPPTVAYLVDSIAATEIETVLRRVEVRHASGRVDTIPGVLTEAEPVAVGDSVVLGVAYDSTGGAVSLFRWDVVSRSLESRAMPSGLESVMNGLSGIAISPNGQYLLSVDFERGTARGVVRSLRTGAVLLRAPAERMASMDGRLGDAEWQSNNAAHVHVLVQDLPTTAVTQAVDLTRRRWSSERTVDTVGQRAVEALFNAVEQLSTHGGGALGVSVALLEQSGHIVAGGHQRYPMQSVYKLPVAMSTLAAVDAGELALDQLVTVTPADYVSALQHSPLRDTHPTGTRITVRELLRLSTSESDGSACDVLFKLLGGPHVVRAWLLRHGLREIEVRNTEREIGAGERVQYDNWATPEGAMALLRSVHTNRAPTDDIRPLLTASSHALLLEWLTRSPTGAKRLRGLLPPGTVVAHKTGSSRTMNGVTAATNDIGIITLPDGRHLGVAVFLRDSRLSEAEREAIIARMARVAWDAYAY